MSIELLNAILGQVPEVMWFQGRLGPSAGRPYARDAPLTPFEYTGVVTFRLADDGAYELLLSCPCAVVDEVGGLIMATRQDREGVIADRVRAIATRAGSQVSSVVAIEPPRVVVGADVVLPSLQRADQRICMPWQTQTGRFVIEGGAHRTDRASAGNPNEPACR